jgi:hypothetical protein
MAEWTSLSLDIESIYLSAKNKASSEQLLRTITKDSWLLLQFSQFHHMSRLPSPKPSSHLNYHPILPYTLVPAALVLQFSPSLASFQFFPKISLSQDQGRHTKTAFGAILSARKYIELGLPVIKDRSTQNAMYAGNDTFGSHERFAMSYHARENQISRDTQRATTSKCLFTSWRNKRQPSNKRGSPHPHFPKLG